MNVVRYEDGQLVQLQDDEGRVPPVVGHLNYPGVLRPSPVGRQVVASRFGAVAAVEARFDVGAGRTWVGYARLPLEGGAR